MVVKVEIKDEDIGLTYDRIKSLLQKFDAVDKQKEKITRLDLVINLKKNDINELSTAIIWRYALLFRSLQCEKTVTISKNLKDFFESVHFFDRLTGKRSPWFSPEVPIHLEVFHPLRPTKVSGNEQDMEKIIADTMNNLLDDKMDFHREVKIQLQEVLNNTFDHSESKTEAAAMCIFRKKDEVSFCSADMGQGIKSSFLSNPHLKDEYSGKRDEEVICDALKFRVSCNPSANRNPGYTYSNGGIGLYFLQKFIATHKDSVLVIISNKGYYYMDSQGRERSKNFQQVEWPGTAVYLRTRLNQNKSDEYKKIVADLVESYSDGIDNTMIDIV